MYRKHSDQSELLSSVLIAFALFILFSILFYMVFEEHYIINLNNVVYLVFASILLLVSLFYLVLYFISLKRSILDYEVDFEQELIRINRIFKIRFKDIKLYATRKNRSEIKVFSKIRLLNIVTFQLQNDTGKELTLKHADQIGKYAIKTNHRHLYNYNFMIMFLFITLNLIYIFIEDSMTYINHDFRYIIVFGITFGFALLLVLINVIRLQVLYRKLKQQNETNTTL